MVSKEKKKNMGNRNSSSKYLDSPVLSNYADEFAKLEKKTKRKKSSNNEEQPPPSSQWNCQFIMALTFVLSLVDLVKYVKEVGFMGN